MNFDILLKNGKIIDGTGTPWFLGDVALMGDKIAAVGNLSQASAQQVLDCTGKVISPGFVDTHVHGDLIPFLDPYHEAAIRQGITTYVVGQDGVAPAPASAEVLEYMCLYTAGFSCGKMFLDKKEKPNWQSIHEYLELVTNNCALNLACLIPNGNIRMEVMGLETRPPDGSELNQMKRLIAKSMEEGAVGISSGLDYIPSLYASTSELTEICKAMAPYGGVYVTHMKRYDAEGLLASMDDVHQIGRDANVPVHISHFNSKAELALPHLDKARKSGVDVTFDLYCYLAGSTILGMIALPQEMQKGGRAATIQRLADKATLKEL
ncbi:MAG: amidohydrolase family protein, partial [Gemmataceae bacterium]|nr:amidohydrolase family protein [Gemmataceae bacterium]